MDSYRDPIFTRLADGAIVVDELPEMLRVAPELLADAACGIDCDDEGHLVILNRASYRPVRFAQGGRVVICERVR